MKIQVLAHFLHFKFSLVFTDCFKHHTRYSFQEFKTSSARIMHVSNQYNYMVQPMWLLL